MTVPHAADIVVRSMTAIERLGRPFEFHVTLESKAVSLKLEDFLGQAATVHTDLPEGEKRHFSGIVTSFGQTAADGSTFQFRLCSDRGSGC